MRLVDRADAGRQLADRLSQLSGEDVVVLGLPRGGVPVAFEIADVLGAALDVIVVRKLGVPDRPELAMGAIGEGGALVLNHDVVSDAHVTSEELRAVEDDERVVLERRVRALRGDRARVPLAGRTAVVVDDGVATGATIRAACDVARAQGAGRIVVAVPVGPADTVADLRRTADAVVCLHLPDPFGAVGRWYDLFDQVSDATVAALLDRSGPPGSGAPLA